MRYYSLKVVFELNRFRQSSCDLAAGIFSILPCWLPSALNENIQNKHADLVLGPFEDPFAHEQNKRDFKSQASVQSLLVPMCPWEVARVPKSGPLLNWASFFFSLESSGIGPEEHPRTTYLPVGPQIRYSGLCRFPSCVSSELWELWDALYLQSLGKRSHDNKDQGEGFFSPVVWTQGVIRRMASADWPQKRMQAKQKETLNIRR